MPIENMGTGEVFFGPHQDTLFELSDALSGLRNVQRDFKAGKVSTEYLRATEKRVADLRKLVPVAEAARYGLN